MKTDNDNGFVLFDEECAADCFEAFAKWASQVQTEQFKESLTRERDLTRFFWELQRQRVEPPVTNLPSPDGKPVPAWVSVSRYVYSDALLDGFISDKHPLDGLEDEVWQWIGSWQNLADGMRSEANDFSPEKAARLIETRAIEVQRTEDGRFATPRSSDGRHRTVALVGLGAPVMPVLLYP